VSFPPSLFCSWPLSLFPGHHRYMGDPFVSDTLFTTLYTALLFCRSQNRSIRPSLPKLFIIIVALSKTSMLCRTVCLSEVCRGPALWSAWLPTTHRIYEHMHLNPPSFDHHLSGLRYPFKISLNSRIVSNRLYTALLYQPFQRWPTKWPIPIDQFII